MGMVKETFKELGLIAFLGFVIMMGIGTFWGGLFVIVSIFTVQDYYKKKYKDEGD